MPTELIEMEGTWEEILARSSELAGKRVHVTAFEEPAEPNEALSERSRQMLDDYLEIVQRPLSDEEQAVLDEFPEFRKQHPIRFRTFADDEL